MFPDVIAPGAGAFYDTNGLLFLSLDELDETADDLARVQPFIGRLQQQPHLAGFISLLLDALGEDAELDYDLDDLYRRLSASVTSANEGRFHRLSWQELMRGGETDSFYRRKMIIVAPSLDAQKPASRLDAMALIRNEANALPMVRAGAARVRLSGNVAMEAEELQSVAQGMVAGGIATLVLVTLVLYFALRSLWLMCASLISLLVGLAATGAFATLAIGHLNLISIAFAVLYIGLGISYAIHLCLRYRELRYSGMPSPEALSTAASDVGTSLFLCAATTSFGFYAFIPTDFEGIAELGLISGTGMYISLFATLTLLPALMRIVPVPPPRADHHFRSPLLGNLGRWIYDHLTWVRAGTVAVTVVSIFFAFRVEFDSNPLNLRDPKSESVATYHELLDDARTSPLTLSVLASDRPIAADLRTEIAPLDVVDSARWVESFVPGDQEDKLLMLEEIGLLMGSDIGDFVLAPPKLERDEAAVAALTDRLGNQASPTAASRELLTALRAWQAEQARATPRERELRLDRLSMSILGTLPREMQRLGAALGTEGFDRSDLPSSITQLWTTNDGEYRIEVVPRENVGENARARRFVAEVSAVAPHATGLPAVQIYAGEAVVAAFQQAFLSAFVLIAILLYGLTRHLRMTIIVLLPLLLAAVATGGAAALLGQPFNFANVIALPMLL
ncbi:MAG: MMPL family transporter, partial [Gammaproteobacteria bacterium]